MLVNIRVMLCYVVFTGPLRKKLKHLKDFNHHPDDNEILPQAGFHESRVFLDNASERTVV